MGLALKTVILGNVIVMDHHCRTKCSFSCDYGAFPGDQRTIAPLKTGLNTYESVSWRTRGSTKEPGHRGTFFPLLVALNSVPFTTLSGSPRALEWLCLPSRPKNSPLSYPFACSVSLPEIPSFFHLFHQNSSNCSSSSPKSKLNSHFSGSFPPSPNTAATWLSVRRAASRSST